MTNGYTELAQSYEAHALISLGFPFSKLFFLLMRFSENLAQFMNSFVLTSIYKFVF